VGDSSPKKRCYKCKQVKPIGAFYKDRSKPDGFHSKCKTCQKGYFLENKERYDVYFKAWRVNNIPQKMIEGARLRAKRDGFPFSIDKHDIHIPDNCPVCGCRLEARRGKGGAYDASPSLDKWNPENGYIPGNVWVICCRCNRRKADMSGEELLAFAFKLIDSFKEHCDQMAQLSA
jgi:hypothetical protein